MDYRFATDDGGVSVRRDGEGTVRVTEANAAESVFGVRPAGDAILVTGERGSSLARVTRDGQTVWVRWRGRTYRLALEETRRKRRTGAGAGSLAAPMPGQVLQHLVEPGSVVEAGTALLVLEAMKMQLEIKAPSGGRVVRFLAEVGERVPSGAALVELEAE